MGKIYGYARVSSREQNLDRQIDALVEFGVSPNQIYADKMSGKDFNRPEYLRLMRRITAEDILIIKSIDRLGRNYNEILEEWRRITKVKQVAVVVIDMLLLDTRRKQENITGEFIADLMLQLLSYVAQIERENIRQRQAEGIASAKARGVRFGRPKINRPLNYESTKAQYLSGLITRQEATSRLNVSMATLGRWLRDDKAKD